MVKCELGEGEKKQESFSLFHFPYQRLTYSSFLPLPSSPPIVPHFLPFPLSSPSLFSSSPSLGFYLFGINVKAFLSLMNNIRAFVQKMFISNCKVQKEICACLCELINFRERSNFQGFDDPWLIIVGGGVAKG